MVCILKEYHIKTKYIDTICTIEKLAYQNKRIALQLIGPEGPECTASVNMPDLPCPEGYTYIKDYSENEGILDELIRHGIVDAPEAVVASGHVVIPLCKVLI